MVNIVPCTWCGQLKRLTMIARPCSGCQASALRMALADVPGWTEMSVEVAEWSEDHSVLWVGWGGGSNYPDGELAPTIWYRKDMATGRWWMKGIHRDWANSDDVPYQGAVAAESPWTKEELEEREREVWRVLGSGRRD